MNELAPKVNNDCESARQKRQQVPSNFYKLISNVDWFKVEKLEISKVAENSVTVDIRVTGKNYSELPQTWSGTIELDKIEGTWKILTLKTLTKE